MHTLILAIFYLLISVSAYAADTPCSSSSSSSSSKQELAIPENNILILSEPTENGVREYQLDLESEEKTLTLESYKTLFEQEDKRGVPGVVCLFPDIRADGEHIQIYEWQSFRKYKPVPSKDPATTKDINVQNVRYFLIRALAHTNPPALAATFLFTGGNTENIIRLNEVLNSYDDYTQNDNATLTRAAFYTSLINTFYLENPQRAEPTESYQALALQFAQFGLEGIPDKPEGILTTRRSFFLRQCAEISEATRDLENAIAYYRRAIDANDSFSIGKLSKLCCGLDNRYTSQQIQLLEEKAATEKDFSILKTIYTHIIPLYSKVGNIQAASTASKKIIDLDNDAYNALKRSRADSPIREQNRLEVPKGPSKRVRRN